MKKFDSINIIPFIDIMLVLLVIVLICSSFIAKGKIKIDLANSKNSEKVTIKKELIISINKNGEYYINKKYISIKDLKNIIKNTAKKTNIILRSDKDTKFKKFVNILDIIKENKHENFYILTNKN